MTEFCSGLGQFETRALHKRDGTPNDSPNAGQPYETISWDEIVALASAPQTVAKGEGRWIIPSSYHEHDARSAGPQKAHGLYWLLIADIDKGSPSLATVLEAVRNVVGVVGFLVYSTRGATEANLKWRVMVLTAVPIVAVAFRSIQTAFNNALEAQGLILDRSTERATQIHFLPNRGEHYEWHHEAGPPLFLDEGHPLVAAGRVIHEEWLAKAAKHSGKRKQHGPRSRIGAFLRRHDPEDILERAGFSTINGRDWHWSEQKSGYSTRLFEDGGIYTKSDSVRDHMGHDYFDGYDLACRLWGAEAVKKQAERYFKEDEDARCGDATSEHGKQVFERLMVYWQKEALERVKQLSRDAEKAVEIDQAIKSERDLQDEKKWRPRLEGLPFEVKATVWEYLAWNAPGLVGGIVRQAAPSATRKTLVPFLAGAMAAQAHLAQGSYVLRWRSHTTPPTFNSFLLGGTGQAKADAFSLLQTVVNGIEVHSKKVRGFTSGPAVQKFLSKNPCITLLDEEGGAGRAASRGEYHFETMVSLLTDAMTSFTTGIEASIGASAETTRDAVREPCTSALLASTPDKYSNSVNASDAESGWLGRWAVIPIQKARKYPQAKPFEINIGDWLVYFSNTAKMPMPPIGDFTGFTKSYIVLTFDDEAAALIDELDAFYDTKETTDKVEEALLARATELVCRLATVVGLSDAVINGNRIDRRAVEWARLFVEASIAYTAPAVLEGAPDPDNPYYQVRGRVERKFQTLTDDARARASAGRRCRVGADGKIELLWSYLLEQCKGGKINSRVIKEELELLIETETLIIADQNGGRWLRWTGK